MEASQRMYRPNKGSVKVKISSESLISKKRKRYRGKKELLDQDLSRFDSDSASNDSDEEHGGMNLTEKKEKKNTDSESDNSNDSDESEDNQKVKKQKVEETNDESGSDAASEEDTLKKNVDALMEKHKNDAEAIDYESDEDGANADDESENDDEGALTSQAAFANALTKILNAKLPSSANNGNAILCRRKLKHLEEEKQKKLVTKDLRIKSEERRKLKHNRMATPNYATGSYEKTLRKIATRGVCALFNAIQKHQSTLEMEQKDEKEKSVSKKDFLDMLRKGSNKNKDQTNNGTIVDSNVTKRTSSESTWAALDDDMLLKNNRMKDFDKSVVEEDDSDSAEGDNAIEIEDSSDDSDEV